MRKGLFNLSITENSDYGNSEILDTEIYDNSYYGESSISIPKNTAITSKVYNNTISALKRSFKEGADILEMLENVEIVNDDIDYLQENYTDSLIEHAIWESYINGPYFESNTNPDKNAIKHVIKEIFKVSPKPRTDRYNFSPFSTKAQLLNKYGETPAIIGNIISIIGSTIYIRTVGGSLTLFAALVGGFVGLDIAATAAAVLAGKLLMRKFKENKEFTMALWQMVGVIDIKDDTPVNDVLAHYSDLFKDQLGDFVLNACKLTIGDFVSDSPSSGYILLVDSKKSKLTTIDIDIDKKDIESVK